MHSAFFMCFIFILNIFAFSELRTEHTMASSLCTPLSTVLIFLHSFVYSPCWQTEQPEKRTKLAQPGLQNETDSSSLPVASI